MVAVVGRLKSGSPFQERSPSSVSGVLRKETVTPASASHPSAAASCLTWFDGTLSRNSEEIEDLIYCHQLAGAHTWRPEGPENNYYQPFPTQIHKSKN